MISYTIDSEKRIVKIDNPVKNPKKLTGTRFAAVQGLNPWTSDFQIWSIVSRLYEPPFEDTIYTIAGKTIEPKQADYMESAYGMDLIRPADVYGKDYFNKTYGDFFHENAIFGGMWDYLLKDEDGNPKAVLEMKTSKRVEDWQNDVPEYYAQQAALYAWLLGVDQVYMVASFLKEEDYADPSAYNPSIDNTIVVPFKVSERYPDFGERVKYALSWWHDHVESGISPEYDEKTDKEFLDVIRTNDTADKTLDDLVKSAEKLKAEVAKFEAAMKPSADQLKKINDEIKKKLIADLHNGMTKSKVSGSKYEWVVSQTNTTTIDKAKLKKDGLLDTYSKKTVSYRLNVKEIK